MLDHAVRLDANEQLQQVQAASAPHMKDGDRRSLINGLKNQARDTMDIVQDANDYDGLDQIKGML